MCVTCAIVCVVSVVEWVGLGVCASVCACVDVCMCVRENIWVVVVVDEEVCTLHHNVKVFESVEVCSCLLATTGDPRVGGGRKGAQEGTDQWWNGSDGARVLASCV